MLARFFPLLATNAGCVFVSCDRPAQAPIVAASPDSVLSQPSAEPWITATPNPIPGETGQGKTTIKWHSGGSTGAVYVGQNSDALFADAADGSQDAPWVDLSINAEFVLYSNRDRQTQLGRVVVTGSR